MTSLQVFRFMYPIHRMTNSRTASLLLAFRDAIKPTPF